MAEDDSVTDALSDKVMEEVIEEEEGDSE